tara:strand:+ start:490 stop:1119 length:630 start_codon:yes stop_codon:yes gene_type:complete
MVQVQQWSGCIKRKGSKFEVNLKKITALVKVAIGELSGLSGLLNNLEGTLLLTCDTSSTNNHFVKVDMSQCGTKLLGVSFYSNSKECSCVGISAYTTELNCKMISADVSLADDEQISKIKDYFNSKFNVIISPTKGNRAPCGPPPSGAPKRKEYKIMPERVPSDDASVTGSNQISLRISEDGSDEDLCEGEAECQAPPPSPNEHREEHL